MRRQVLLTALFVVVSSSSVRAFVIDSVSISPGGEITPTDPIHLEVLIFTSSASAFLYQPTEVVVDGNEILITIYIDAGILAMLDSLVETVQLGTLEPGDYIYTVHLEPPPAYGWPVFDRSSGFTVQGAVDACSLPADVGECDGICPRYFYNNETALCELFNYGCCSGNANNFTTLEECEYDCMGITPQGVAPIPTVSSWGMMIVALLLLNAGTIAIINKRTTLQL